MSNALQKLIDRREIEDVVIRYCRGLDRNDADLVLSCFFADAVEDHGTFYGSPVDFVEKMSKPSWAKRKAALHYVTNQLVEFEEDDVARSEALVYAELYSVIDGQDTVDCVAGRYISRFERRNGEWRIARRVFVLEWGEKRPINFAFPPGVEQFQRGKPFPYDLVYEGQSTSRN